jgi:hypothetical protein
VNDEKDDDDDDDDDDCNLCLASMVVDQLAFVVS